MVQRRSLVPIALALLELIHPTWSEGSVGETVQPLAVEWVVLHLCLLFGYLGLVVVLWRATRSRYARWMLVVFCVCNTAYLALDGVGVGLLARGDPAAADRLWDASGVMLLGDLTGATWAAALMLIALGPRPQANPVLSGGAAVAWVTFVASAIPGAAVAGTISRIVALGTGAWSVYQGGSSNLPIALFIFASVLRQHVGPEAALALVFVAVALATERSNPVAACPP